MDLSIHRITFKNFRSYDSFELSDLGALTILVGPNAVGKTNIIEGVQLLTALQSFRRPLFEQMVRQGSDFARLDADLSDGSRNLALSLRLSEGKKQYLLNGKGKRTADLKGIMPSVTFTPDDLELVKGTSASRRAAIDGLGSQLSSNHYVIKRDYEKVVRYKNRLLKEAASSDLVASIDEMLVTCGAQLACYRAALFEKLTPVVKSYYDAIVGGREEMDLCYIPSWEVHDANVARSFSFDRATARICLERALRQREAEERAPKNARVGPQADPIEFFIGARNAGIYGSQGQQRSLVLAFKLAEASLIQGILHQKPVLLLDDVMSELDASRRNALVSFIEGDIQTFITTTNLTYFDDELLSRARIVELSQAG
ncbi:MAG: DNA replication and repair protein RecF [Gordonibacter sp.]